MGSQKLEKTLGAGVGLEWEEGMGYAFEHGGEGEHPGILEDCSQSVLALWSSLTGLQHELPKELEIILVQRSFHVPFPGWLGHSMSQGGGCSLASQPLLQYME